MPESNKTETGLKGEVVYFFAFDLANEIQLDRARELLGSSAVVVNPDFSRPVTRALPGVRPLSFEPKPVELHLNGVPARLFARLFPVGVLSLTVRLPFACEQLSELGSFHAPRLGDGRTLEEFARAESATIARRIEPALIQPGAMAELEQFTVFYLTNLGGQRDVNAWLAGRRRAAAGLLANADAESLSEAQAAEELRLQRSFKNTDVAVIDWDAALVIDLDAAGGDVLFVLELANLQLEEFRWMDAALDGYLERAYGDLAAQRWWSYRGPVGVVRSLRTLQIDLARLADEVTHITKFVGDSHLARIYQMARERFHLEQWRSSVRDRLGELDRLYTMLRGDIYDRRMLLLEAIIVIFFAIDLTLLFLKR